MKNETATAGIIAALSFIEPHAAIGALAGVCFFLAIPQEVEWWRLTLLTIVSGLLGYGAGVSEWGANNMMLTSSIVSALGVALLVSVRTALKEKVMEIIAIILKLRK